MRLLTKFTVIFTVVFGLGLAMTGFFLWNVLHQNARSQVIQQAQLMMESALATRNYTSEKIQPVLTAMMANTEKFYPQSVPAFGATEDFNYLRKTYPEYTYKESALNPTNLRDRATDWEADIINHFRNNPETRVYMGERDTPGGRALFLARPIRAAPSCLVCHSEPDNAPAKMTELYGKSNGFGWKSGEVIAAQIVTVPMSVPVALADKAFKEIMILLVAVGIAALAVLDLTLWFTVIRPVVRFAGMADEISKGHMDIPELAVDGHDEISVLAAAFNRMHRSLAKALQMLDGQ